MENKYSSTASFLNSINCGDSKNYIYNSLILGSLLDGLKGKKILDIGCGNNVHFPPYLCDKLLEKGANPVGIDVAINPERYNFKCYSMPAHTALEKPKDNEFDAVITSRFFSYSEFLNNYLDTTEEIIKNIYRVLRKGGFYVNSWHPKSIEGIFHIAGFTLPFKELCEKQKFRLHEFYSNDKKGREVYIFRK